ncbi:MAG TPA: DMT family transporter [Anaerolineales bacterium]|nr:DMT family transporter [Anaerolineales bacterium]
MIGALWSLAAGIGFGVFQAFNRQAVRGMDVFVSTFLQLFVSAILLVSISLITQDVQALLVANWLTWLNFSLAGFFHFLIGWTFLNASQKRIGAARTSSLIGTTPLFSGAVAALTLSEFPTWLTVLGIFIIVGGVYLVNSAKLGNNAPGVEVHGLRSVWQGLAAAICWSISPIFIRWGLAELPSPILGVTVGITASAIVYGVILLIRRVQGFSVTMIMDATTIKIIAAILVGLSTWARWIALDLTQVAIVLALSLVSVPVVNWLSPLVSGRDVENVTLQIWMGSGLIIIGSLILILF